MVIFFFFFNDTATTEIYTLSLHDALPIFEPDARPESQDIVVSMNPESLLLEGARRVDEWGQIAKKVPSFDIIFEIEDRKSTRLNSSHANISYAVFCLKKKKT